MDYFILPSFYRECSHGHMTDMCIRCEQMYMSVEINSSSTPTRYSFFCRRDTDFHRSRRERTLSLGRHTPICRLPGNQPFFPNPPVESWVVGAATFHIFLNVEVFEIHLVGAVHGFRGKLRTVVARHCYLALLSCCQNLEMA
ncbi:unnamed protein product [Sphacelaria rigidula]